MIAQPCEKLIKDFPFRSHFRLGEQFPFRGRQTICKYYDSNEIINNQLIRIKSATTAVEFERIFNEQHRYKHGYSKSTKSIEPYYDIQTVLEPPLRAVASETCLCAKEFYRLDYNLQQKRPAALVQQSLSANAIKRLTVDDKSFNAFLRSASECYDTCIQHYLNDLNTCNQKAEFIARQSLKRPASNYSFGIRSLKLESKFPDETSLTNQLRKLSLNLEKPAQVQNCARQSSTSHRSFQAMSCSDTNNNNNNTESTNAPLKDPPKIICSDFSSATQQEIQKSVSDCEKDFSSDKSGLDKNCLTIPHTNYCSEARPP